MYVKITARGKQELGIAFPGVRPAVWLMSVGGL